MPPEITKPTQPSSDGEKNKQFDREVRDMLNTLTHRLADIHKPGASHHQHRETDEEDLGVRIITLAGNNTGATMRSELDEKTDKPLGVSFGEPEALGTYVNSNFQAVNNSIMLGSSYTTNDPGVHMDVIDTFDSPVRKADKHGKKGKKKDKDTFKSDQQSGHSD